MKHNKMKNQAKASIQEEEKVNIRFYFLWEIYFNFKFEELIVNSEFVGRRRR